LLPITSRLALPLRRRRSKSDNPMPSDEAHDAGARSLDHVAAPIETEDAARELSNGPIGAFFVASIAVGLLFLGWLAFYFLLFMPRGPIG
jgi:hypothetical protein